MHGSFNRIRSLLPCSIVIEISECNVIDLNEGNGLLDHAGRIEDDAIPGNRIDHNVIVLGQQRLVGQEIHKSLEDAAGWRTLRLAQRDDAWGLDPVGALEEGIPDLHPAEDVREAKGKEMTVPDIVLDLLAVPPANLGRYATGPEIAYEGLVSQGKDLDILHLRVRTQRTVADQGCRKGRALLEPPTLLLQPRRSDLERTVAVQRPGEVDDVPASRRAEVIP